MSRSPRLSVVIPTRNRRDRLEATLEALAREAKDLAFEVLVVDDGSQDDTRSFVEQRRASLPFRLVLLTQASAGPAAARNRGIAAAEAPTVLLLGDDTRPTPGALLRHLELADGHELAVQGHIDWDPEQEITPLMDFLAPAGPQFYFRGLEHGETLPFTAVLGSNLSAPTAWFRDEPFDESFPHAAVEDTEMAWRWYRRGRRAVYSSEALCFHHHRYDDLDAFLARQHRAGKSARHAIRLHWRLFWPLLGRQALFTPWIFLRRFIGRGRPTDPWDLACRKAFFRGFFA